MSAVTARTFTIRQATRRFVFIVEGVSSGGREAVITIGGVPVAVVMDYRKFAGRRTVFLPAMRRAIGRQMRSSRRYFDGGGRGLTIRQVLGR